MAWIESHQSLGRHPKTKRLARLLGVSCPCAIGHLHYLWWWCLDYAQDGNLDRFSVEDIAEASEWEGDAREMVVAFIQAGFIDETNDGYRVHDWDEYAGKLIDRRVANAKRMREARSKPVQNTCSAREEHVQTCVELPNPTIPNRTEQQQQPRAPAREEPAAVPATPQTPPAAADFASVLEAEGYSREEVTAAKAAVEARPHPPTSVTDWARYLRPILQERRQTTTPAPYVKPVIENTAARLRAERDEARRRNGMEP